MVALCLKLFTETFSAFVSVMGEMPLDREATELTMTSLLKWNSLKIIPNRQIIYIKQYIQYINSFGDDEHIIKWEKFYCEEFFCDYNKRDYEYSYYSLLSWQGLLSSSWLNSDFFIA